MKSDKRKHPTHPVIQEHHVRYKGVPRFPSDSTEEWTEIVYVGEHFMLSQLSWRKRISKGFIASLKEYVRVHEKEAVELHKIDRSRK